MDNGYQELFKILIKRDDNCEEPVQVIGSTQIKGEYMDFEEYWNKKTLKENFVIHNLANQLYHLLRKFAKEIWEEAQKNR